jgi:phosphohistidine phosphatase
MRGYVVRHGSAAPGPDDWARPLTPAGRAEVEATARALAARRVEVAEIRHSGLRRARETAEILAAVLRPAGGVVAAAGLAPEDPPEEAHAELAHASEPLMLVGHMPHLGRLLALLLGGAAAERIRLRPGTAVGLERVPDGWRCDFVVPPDEAGGP